MSECLRCGGYREPSPCCWAQLQHGRPHHHRPWRQQRRPRGAHHLQRSNARRQRDAYCRCRRWLDAYPEQLRATATARQCRPDLLCAAVPHPLERAADLAALELCAAHAGGGPNAASSGAAAAACCATGVHHCEGCQRHAAHAASCSGTRCAAASPVPYPQANAAQQPMVSRIQPSWPQPVPFAGSSQPGCPTTMQPPQLQPQPQHPFHVPAAPSYGVSQQHGTGVPVGAAQPHAAAQPGGGGPMAQQPQSLQAMQQQQPKPMPVQAMQQPSVPQPAPAAEQPPAPQPVQAVQQPPTAQQPQALACPAAVPQPLQSSVVPPSQPQGLACGPAAEPSAVVVPAPDAPSASPMPPGLFTAA